MRILFVVPYTPSLIRSRSYNLIMALADRGHELTLLTLWSSEEERAGLDGLAPYCRRVIALPLPRWRSLWNCLITLPSRTPLQASFCWQPALARELATLVESRVGEQPPFDLVHVEHLRGARYVLPLHQQLWPGARLPIIWDSVDCITHLFRQTAERSGSRMSRWLARFELGRTAQFEGRVARQVDRVLVTSEVERRELLALCSDGGAGRSAGQEGARIEVLGHGVDPSYFLPTGAAGRREETLVISGKMSYHANVTMALYLLQEIMPLIWAMRPNVKLWIAGKDPARSILAAAEDPRVTVTGTVPDLRPYLQQATVAVAPLPYGAGIQNKILEAMACALPVVASPQAAAALAARPGEEFLLADTPPALAQTIVDLLDQPARRETIGWAGRRYVERHHDWASLAARLEEIYFTAAEVRQPA